MKKNNLSDDDIIVIITILEKSFRGVQDDISTIELQKYFSDGDYGECIRIIKKQLRLPLTIRVIYAEDSSEPTLSLRMKRAYQKVTSTAPVRTKTKVAIPKQSEDSPAFIQIPQPLPMYGSKAFENITIPMYLRTQVINENNFESFCLVVTHELSHIVLHSLRHTLRYSEVATDITGMILGFIEVIKIGRSRVIKKTKTEKTIATYGYLSDEQFRLAYDTIQSLK